jgi:dihydrofolate reductase
MAENRVIGRGDALPWHLPRDLQHFKRLTMGHALIIGRRTFASIGRALPGRHCIVVSRDPDLRLPEGVRRAGGWDEALALTDADDEVFVGGGAELYRLALPHAHRVYLTLVHAEFEGDTMFPPLARGSWRLMDTEHHPADDRNAFPLSFQRYERNR